jgi:uncharacterized membrane protein YgcG
VRRLLHAFATAVFAAALAGGTLAQTAGPEEILEFGSDISVHANGTMTVIETIRVRATGQRIRRGIYRDFPTTYRDTYGNQVKVRFEVTGVQRNGRPEPYRSEARSNGVRTYIGDPDVIIGRGVHGYRITYETDRQIGFFEDWDELYWNVTGNGWIFPIRSASATVRLPGDAKVTRATAYTGPFGARGTDFESSIEGQGNIRFATTRSLAANEGLTIVVAWPKGFVAEPGAANRVGYFLDDNRVLLIAAAAFAVVLIYYLVVWHLVGRDPASGTVIALFAPPAGISPAVARFVTRMGYDDRAFSAAILSMAAKGFLDIHEAGGFYSLVRTGGGTTPLSRGERGIASMLFKNGDTVHVDADKAKMRSARVSLGYTLAAEFEKASFKLNSGYTVPGVVLTVIGASAVLTGSSTFLGTTTPADFTAVAVIAAAGFLTWLFTRLLKAPTVAGRRLLDQIEGFKMYLSTAEQHRLEALHPPEVTPAVFEKYLPYAMALDVENEWNDKFSRDMAAAGVEPGRDGGYRPSWYHGRHWSGRDIGHVATDISGTFGGSISAAAAPPASSSGFSGGGGGGGSSGGGGGGGGGGGW